jgi:hypothetical protein
VLVTPRFAPLSASVGNSLPSPHGFASLAAGRAACNLSRLSFPAPIASLGRGGPSLLALQHSRSRD